jgi:cyclic 2,3-diphosphoglycerate synthetase
VEVLALVDGEHHPPVTRWAIEVAGRDGLTVVAALLAGGAEKLGPDRDLDLGGVPLLRSDGELTAALGAALDELRPDAVLDLSDEPVIGNELRMELAAVTLARGLPYLGSDFRLDPPVTGEPLATATIAVIGSGKRVAKTAVGGHLARLAADAGHRPVVVAMGRGGPPEPEVAGPEDVTLDALRARAARGGHAASDFLEDALTSGVTTVGARRAGGGLGGRPFVTNVAEAAGIAVRLGGDPVILEGSGSSMPGVPWDAGALVVPAGHPARLLGGHLGPLRVLLSDLVILTMGVGPNGPENLSALDSYVRRLRPDVRVAIAELHPVPLQNVRGKDAFFATTASPEGADRLGDDLERTTGCRVVTVSAHLADPAALRRDLASAPPFDVLLTELKAAAIDVAAPVALERGAEVVFVENRPTAAGGDDLDDALRDLVKIARERAAQRMTETAGT